MSFKAKIVLFSVAVPLMASTALYAADTSMEPTAHSVHVRYTDLNLNRHADVARLYRRISLAADHVCGPRYFAGYRTPGHDSCVANAIEQSVATVDSAALTAFYQGETRIAQSNGDTGQSR